MECDKQRKPSPTQVMRCRKPVLTIVTSFLLVLVFYLLNIGSDISVGNNYSIYAPLESDYYQKVNESVSQTIGEIEFRVNQTDEYLRRLMKKSERRGNSRLIYAKDIYGMTHMTINQMPCSDQFGKDLTLIVMVFNRVNAFDRRQTIRETWGQTFRYYNKTRIYFTVGLSVDSSVQQRLEKENNKFGDILQFNYYESYYNCTIKAIGLLRWTALNCPKVKFMLKVDDDSLVLANNLIQFCESSDSKYISGYLWHKPLVFRGSDKWSISRQDYTSNQYPDYIAGPYLMPGSAAVVLYETAITKSLPALPFEDVYITGVVAQKCQIERKHMTSLLYLTKGCQPTAIDYCFYKNYTIFWQQFDDQSLRSVWTDFKKDRICSTNRSKRC